MSKTRPENPASVAARQPEVAASVFCHALDSQRRITVPCEWRPMIGVKETMMVLKDPDKKRLIIFLPLLTQKMSGLMNDNGLAVFGEDAEARTCLLDNSQNITMDAAGRIRVSDSLLITHAGVTKNVKLQGNGGSIVLSATNSLNPDESMNEVVPPVDNPNPAYRNALIKFGILK